MPIHQIADAMGLTQKTAIEIYRHHHPDDMKDAGRAVAARLRATETQANGREIVSRHWWESAGTKGQNRAKTAFSAPRPAGVKIDEKA